MQSGLSMVCMAQDENFQLQHSGPGDKQWPLQQLNGMPGLYRDSLNGKCGTRHQRQPVLCVHCEDITLRRQTCRIWTGAACCCCCSGVRMEQVVDGFSVVKAIETVGSGGGTTMMPVVVADSGVVEPTSPGGGAVV